jgi:hypothetical protein
MRIPDHHFSEKSDPYPHSSEMLDTDLHLSDVGPQPRSWLALFWIFNTLKVSFMYSTW